MQHKGTQAIEAERLILRKFRLDDAGDMFKNWANDAEVTRFLTWLPHESEKDTTEILEKWISEYESERFYQWAIELKEIGQPIGSISVVRVNDTVNEMEIGYCIGRKWWRQGYTSEALKAVIEYLFSEVGAKRVCAKHDTDNPNSGKVMLKCGLEYEGTLRRAGKNNSNPACNLAIYSILNY